MKECLLFVCLSVYLSVMKECLLFVCRSGYLSRMKELKEQSEAIRDQLRERAEGSGESARLSHPLPPPPPH